jgi:Pentapeptide repeats (9 copies)
MDTDSKIRQPRKIVDVEILDIDKLGYGPKGALTRRDWRKECLDNLLAGKDAFYAWQYSWTSQINTELPEVRFGARLNYDDGSYLFVLDGVLEKNTAWSLDFVGQIFGDQFINAHGTVFTQTALFSGATFAGDVNFSRSEFNSNADFSTVLFKADTYFSSAVFNWNSNFSNFKCRYNISFSRAKFIRDADFSLATFCRDSYFTSATFSECADFHDAVFSGEAGFVKTKFLSTCIFQNNIFNTKSDFENAIFDNIGHFEESNFKTRIPAFRGCKIDSTRLEFSEKTSFPENDIEVGAIENISFLKRLSDEHGQTDQALRFNAMELNAKYAQIKIEINKIYPLLRIVEANWWFAKTTYLYKIFSNYGRSFIRPIVWYVGVLIITSILVMAYSTYSKRPIEERQALCKQLDGQPPPLKLSYERAVFEYAMFRAGGLMDFTDTGKQNNAVNCRLFEEPIEPPLMRAWGIFKGIASIALLFLAALGLRNKYRIK